MRSAPALATAFAALAGGAALVGTAFAWGQPAEAVARGAGLYARYCVQCHGALVEGSATADGTPAPPLGATGHAWRHPDAQLARIVAQGLRDPAGEGMAAAMPGFAGRLGRGEIRAVLDYVKSTWPADIRAAQAALAGGGKEAMLALLRDPGSRLPGTCLPSGAGGKP